MKKFVWMMFLLSALQVHAASFKVSTLNLEGWSGTATRFQGLGQLLTTQKMLQDVSVLMVQESIEQSPYSSAGQLAQALGWKYFSQRRVSDMEGLGILYPPQTEVTDIQTYQIKAKYNFFDYARMALSAQIRDPHWGLVRVVNTHLAHLPKMGETRRLQLQEVVAWIQQLEQKNPSRFVIFGGDFNTGPSEVYYTKEFDVLSQSPLHFKHIQSAGADYTWVDKSENKKELIDHFFISQPGSLFDLRRARSRIFTKTSEQDFSDHNLVVLDLQYGSKL